jgi:hypothetical protein
MAINIPKEVVAGLLIMVGPLIAAIYSFHFSAENDQEKTANDEGNIYVSDDLPKAKDATKNPTDHSRQKIQDNAEAQEMPKKTVGQFIIFSSGDSKYVCQSRLSIVVTFHPNPISGAYKEITIDGIETSESPVTVDMSNLPLKIINSCFLSYFRFVDFGQDRKRVELALNREGSRN